MKEEEFEQLDRGDIVRHRHDPPQYTFVVDRNFGDRVTALSSVDLTNPPEWVLVRKAGQNAQRDPEKPSSKLEDFKVYDLGKMMGLDANYNYNSPDNKSMGSWITVSCEYLAYKGCRQCSNVLGICMRATLLAARTVFRDTRNEIQIGDSNEGQFTPCTIRHFGCHPWGSGVFDINIPLILEGSTRYGAEPLTKIWDGDKLLTNLIDWETLYLFIRRVHMFSQQSAWMCLVHPDIREYVIEKVEEYYGAAEAEIMSRILHAEYHHALHIHINPGKFGVFDQKFFGVNFEILKRIK